MGRGRVGEAGNLRDVVWNTLKSGGHMKDSIYNGLVIINVAWVARKGKCSRVGKL